MPEELHVLYRQRLAELLGIAEDASLSQIHCCILQGLPATILCDLCKNGDVLPVDRDRIIPLNTLKARLARQRTLTVAESDRLFRVVHIIAMARALFGDSKKAAHWLNTPKARFGHQSPMSLARTFQGVRLVEEMLVQVAEGYCL